jgi:hypothetical protein
MQVKIIPSTSQIRYCVESALSGFETLDTELAVSEACSELRALLRYLDAVDNADSTSNVLVSKRIKPRIIFEDALCNTEG